MVCRSLANLNRVTYFSCMPISAVLWLRVGFLSLGQVLLTKVRIGWYIGIRNIQNIESVLTGIFRLSAIQYVQRI